MNIKKVEELIHEADPSTLREALRILMIPHASPVFGAVKVIEHEIAALEALRILGYIPKDADEFSLVEALRVTKAKAKSLLYNSALRNSSQGIDVDSLLRDIIVRSNFCKDGDMFLFEVPHPLTMDRLRHKVRKLGFVSDGTFSGSVARIQGDALVALIEALIPSDQKRALLKKLHNEGYEGKDIASIIKRIAIQTASAAGGKALGQLAEGAVNGFWPLLSGQFEKLNSNRK